MKWYTAQQASIMLGVPYHKALSLIKEHGRLARNIDNSTGWQISEHKLEKLAGDTR